MIIMIFKKITGSITFLLSRRHKIYKLRKRYDRVREKANKVRDPKARAAIFSVLDQIESNIIILEEQNVSRFERGRMMRFVSAGTKKASQMLKESQTK